MEKDFFVMNVSQATISGKPKIGTCPHGMPLGTCPICSGMGGGGGSKTSTKPSKEMSWDECYAVWQQIIKAKDLAQKKRNEALNPQAESQIKFTSKIDNVFSIKIANLIENLSNISQQTKTNGNILPKTIAIMAKIAIPILNVIKNVVVLTQKAISFIQQKCADISDKLNAIFGELKNSVDKKISDKFKNFKKKFKSLFEINEQEKIDNEDKKLEKLTEGQST